MGRQTSIEKLERLLSRQQSASYVDFIASGIGCHALAFLSKLDIANQLASNTGFKFVKSDWQEGHAKAILAALTSLIQCGVVTPSRKHRYQVTALGRELIDHIGLISMLFEGYGKLMLNQIDQADRLADEPWDHVNGKAVAYSSIQFGANTVDPIIDSIVRDLQPTGTLVDLGCGCGTRLHRLCNIANVSGLGFEIDEGAIHYGSRVAEDSRRIELRIGDITKLRGIYANVEIVLQCFVMHDFSEDNLVVNMLQQYRTTFPKMKYFIYTDVTSSSPGSPTYMPGFDYVHGLQGIAPRTSLETLALFDASGYEVHQQFSTSLPNTFVWLLKPNK